MSLMDEAFTFGHRIALGQLVESGVDDYELMRKTMELLHQHKLRRREIRKLLDYFEAVLVQLKDWSVKEQSLQYEPTPEERQAGLLELGKQLKEFSTVDAIATRLHISHDDALRLPYGTVYMMLLKDSELHKFERRLHKIHERKMRR